MMDGTRDQSTGRMSRREFLRRSAGAAVVLPSAAAILAACGGGGEQAAPTTPAVEQPQAGGRLLVGWVGGGAAETLDPSLAVNFIDAGRMNTLYDQLVKVKPDFSLEMELAEAFEPNADATEWTIRLRDGVVWHDGKPFGADDVLYTIQRNGAPGSTAAGASTVATFDIQNIQKLDDLTLRIPLKTAIGDFPSSWLLFPMSIVQDGDEDFSKPVGTGPFMYDKFTAGQSSLFKKNPNYWRDGQPYVDELEFLSIPDHAARLNALISGEIDAMEGVPYAQALEEKDAGRIQVLIGDGPNIVPITMAVTLDPFTNVGVTQAMRLIADRQALVDGAQLGLGHLGNDLYGRGLKWYHDELPQREQDLDQAKSLLKEAGAEGLEVTLYSSTLFNGMLESATIFAEQARGAGVNVKVDNGPQDTYFTDRYLQVAFAQSAWNGVPIPNWMEQAVICDAVWPETKFCRPGLDKLVRTAQGTLDEEKAKTLWWDAQEILWNEGGYLIWGTAPFIDGLGNNVRGAVPSGFFSFGNFGFREWWLAA